MSEAVKELIDIGLQCYSKEEDWNLVDKSEIRNNDGELLGTTTIHQLDIPKPLLRELRKGIFDVIDDLADEKQLEKEFFDIFFHNKSKKAMYENKYFKKLLFEGKRYTAHSSFHDVINNDDTLIDILTKIFRYKNTFISIFDGLVNKKSYRALYIIIHTISSNSNICISNFNLAFVRYMVKKYVASPKGFNYLDTSCGWGVRMLGALSEGMNYYGIDPNQKLQKQLNIAHDGIKSFIDKMNNGTLFGTAFDLGEVHLKSQGSEIFIPEWENKMDFSLTSPPYFALEDYKYGEQSIKNYSEYDEWLNYFLKPTIENTYRYLKSGSVMCINIKDYNNHNIEEMTVKYAVDSGFVFLERIKYCKNTRISNMLNGDKTGDEYAYVFKKPLS